MRATRRADRPAPYLQRRRTHENVISATDLNNNPPYSGAALAHSTGDPSFAQHPAPPFAAGTHCPNPQDATELHKWPHQPYTMNTNIDDAYWNHAMTAPISDADPYAPNMMLTDLTTYDSAYLCQNASLVITGPISSEVSDGGASESQPNCVDEVSNHSCSMTSGTPRSSDIPPNNTPVDHDMCEPTEQWPMFRCTPSSHSAIDPHLGRLYLEGLLQASRPSSVSMVSDSPQNNGGNDPAFDDTDSFDTTARDKLMGIAQFLLIKGWETHSKGGSHVSATITLPSLSELHMYFRSYIRHYEPFYSIYPLPKADVRALLDNREESISCLMLLLLIAQGALVAHPTAQARKLALGITEACRIGMLDILEKNVSMSIQPDMLRCILVYLNLASWSGTRWHMDVSFGFLSSTWRADSESGKVALSQHSMYLSVSITYPILFIPAHASFDRC